MKLLDRAPRWDKHRNTFLKFGLICSLTFVFMAFNYTSYAPIVIYELDGEPLPEVLEVTPPLIRPKKVIPPPPKPKLELSPVIEPDLQPEFIEDLPTEPEEKTEVTVSANDDPQPAPTAPPVELITPAPEEDDIPVIFAERMPVYNTCDIELDESARKACTQEKMLKHIYSKLKYPAIARENNIQGMVVVSFVIDKKGQIQNPEIMKDIGGGCGQAVINTINGLGHFFPGKQNGRTVAVIYRIPVRFKLE